ncbi:1,4-dihydroxy-2-naphthoyl-CoA hydrolase [Desulfacinum infernum DSM 9756]|jgi:acyl-CoA thioester hydrolase|uniref:1,4-dihydroxy-2-naphthoyl-CoA hydrolase n=1 Tax=Desulfacinum infernum DSM 9756 TaxID=1121391 RepID=A0A1M5H8C2_9BACT|nr:thioesterase family protein [Desulfacinum infernum]SHG12133.1 1,4-dihydroxy-2-naphthoyl-CoA hydrolase [Desulfacinum infernum DSM 9756]
MVKPPAHAPEKSLKVAIPVRFGDTDPYGVVYFASYFRYCHHGIEELLRHVGCPPHEYFRNADRGFGLPIVGASCDFLRPVRYGDELNLFVSVLRLGARSVTFGFHFYLQGSPECVGRGQASMTAIDRTWRSCQLPEELRNGLEPYLASEAVDR